jgi:dethiobiotin synthetase
VSVLIVTGTGTGVGKTITTAAIAALASGPVAVVKLAQTGVADGEAGDLAEVARLSGVTSVHEFARYPEPLSPHHAARRSGRPDFDLGDAVLRLADLEAAYDLVLVEGSGGLLVPFDSNGTTLLDVAGQIDAAFVVVTAAGLGTLNHTALTMRALDEEEADVAGIVIGSWPETPGIAERCNVVDLAGMARSGQLSGVLPENMALGEDFETAARAALGPILGGTFDWPAFRAKSADKQRREDQEVR